MFQRFSLSFLCVMSLTLIIRSADAGDIQYKIDNNGNKVFYNIPTIKPSSTESKPVRIAFSRNASDYISLIEEAATRHGVDPMLVKAVIQIESNYNPHALSPKGACGLMQLMPFTAARFGVKQIFDPKQNVDGGTRYLKQLLTLFDSELTLAVAAYNAGEGTVKRLNAVPRYTETQDYVRKVLALYNGDSSYSPYRWKQTAHKVSKPAVYYKYVDANGVTHYSDSPVAGSDSKKVPV